MSEYPYDVMVKAGWIDSCLFSLKDKDRVPFIARAIMAERERAVTAFLDAVLADPEAMERLAIGIVNGASDHAENAVEALKQEASR